VAGISTNALEFNPETVFGSNSPAPGDKLLVPSPTYEASGEFVTIERWFQHVE